MCRSVVCGLVVVVLFGAMALTEESGSAALDVETERVVIFKDGYCMFVKEAQGKTDAAGKAVIEDIPEAMVLGSFWVIPEKGKLTSMVAKKQMIPRKGGQETEKSLVLAFDTKGKVQAVKLVLTYFGPGIRWIPTYRIALDKDKAHMLMQAELLNEAEDLSEVPVDLVVGVPNFRFKNVVSPLSLEAELQNPLRRVAPQLMRQDLSNVAFLGQQRMSEVRGRRLEERGAGDAGVPALPPELAGEGAQDLFVYHVPELSLRAGQRAALPLISVEVPLRHFYTWDVQLRQSGVQFLPGAGARQSPVKLLKNEVWHLIELENERNVPWTTGAALVMEGYLPLAQELLTYTSPGGRCQVPLTVAVDVRGTYREEQTDRKLKAIHLDGNDYTKVSKKGALRVTNYKKESIELVITCQFGGNATGASDKGLMVVTDYVKEDWGSVRGHPALNGHSTIEWELKLKPRETKEVTCEYEYYTR